MTPAELAALHQQCFTFPRPWSAAEFTGYLADPMVIALSAPGAILLGRVIADEAELLTVAVAPDQRRNGLAAKLLSTFHEQALERGAKMIFLEVAADNVPAQALYTQCGYTLAGTRRGYYRAPDGTRIDAMVLQYRLKQHH